MAEYEIVGFADTMPGDEPKAKKERKPRTKKLSKKALVEMFKQFIANGNFAYGLWAGEVPTRKVWMLSESEIDLEANAFAELALQYDAIMEWLNIGGKYTPIAKFLMVQYLVFGMKVRIYVAIKGMEKHQLDSMQEQQAQQPVYSNGSQPQPEPDPFGAFVPGAWMNNGGASQ